MTTLTLDEQQAIELAVLQDVEFHKNWDKNYADYVREVATQVVLRCR